MDWDSFKVLSDEWWAKLEEIEAMEAKKNEYKGNEYEHDMIEFEEHRTDEFRPCLCCLGISGLECSRLLRMGHCPMMRGTT